MPATIHHESDADLSGEHFECLHELELIVDMLDEGGIGWTRHSISTTAEYGDHVSGPRVVDESSREAMEQILAEIQDGTLAEDFVREPRDGEEFAAMRRAGREEQIEHVGERLRGMMPGVSTPDVPE